MVTKWISKKKNGKAAGQAAIDVRGVRAGGEVGIDWITGLTNQTITGPSENISEIIENFVGEQVDANEILLFVGRRWNGRCHFHLETIIGEILTQKEGFVF